MEPLWRNAAAATPFAQKLQITYDSLVEAQQMKAPRLLENCNSINYIRLSAWSSANDGPHTPQTVISFLFFLFGLFFNLPQASSAAFKNLDRQGQGGGCESRGLPWNLKEGRS